MVAVSGEGSQRVINLSLSLHGGPSAWVPLHAGRGMVLLLLLFCWGWGHGCVCGSCQDGGGHQHSLSILSSCHSGLWCRLHAFKWEWFNGHHSRHVKIVVGVISVGCGKFMVGASATWQFVWLSGCVLCVWKCLTCLTVSGIRDIRLSAG